MDGGSTSGVKTLSTIATVSNVAVDFFVTDPAITPLVVGDLYTFRVIAVNVVGDSVASGTLSAMAAVRPNAPENPRRMTASIDSVTIQWNAPFDDGGDKISDYNVYWDYGLGGGSFFPLGSSMGQTQFTKSGLSPAGSKYRFKITAINRVGEGSQSTEIMIIAAT